MDAGRAGGRSGNARGRAGHGRLRRAACRTPGRRSADAEAPPGRHLHARLLGTSRRAGSVRTSERGAVGRPEAWGPLRCRPWRRQFRLADRGTGARGTIPARFDFHRPARREHEWRDERHAQRHEQVPGAGDAARERRSTRHVERGACAQAGRVGHLSVGANADVAVLRLERGELWLRRFVRRAVEGRTTARVRADAARRESRLRSQWYRSAGLESKHMAKSNRRRFLAQASVVAAAAAVPSRRASAAEQRSRSRRRRSTGAGASGRRRRRSSAAWSPTAT